MPSASTTICQQCQVAPSKYTCPACKARTCSLGCTKAHKSSSCASSSTTQPTAGSSSSTPSPDAMISSRNPVASGNGGGIGFVPLSEYGEAQMMQDYLFLSNLSRSVSEEGRKILSLNLPIPSSSFHPSSSSPGGGRSNQQRQREQLMKQFHYRRFRVMLLPDGMARRRLNQSAFSAKEKKLWLTVEIKTAAPGEGEGEGGKGKEVGWVVGKVDSERTIEQVLLAELQFRSFTSKRELQKAREILHPSTKQGPKDKEKENNWIIARKVLDEAGLPIPPTSACFAGAEGEGEGWVVLENFPENCWSVLVPVYSARLTNESTTRYLDWWNRKRRWEQANPELAPQQRSEEKREPQSGFVKRMDDVAGDDERNVRPRTWGKTEGEGDREDGKANSEEEEKEPVHAGLDGSGAGVRAGGREGGAGGGGGGGGIVSSSLLSLLSQRLGRTQTQTQVQASSTPASATTNVPAPTPTTADDAPNTNTTPNKPEQDNARSIMLNISSPCTTTLSWMLRCLPDGYSIVEFPELRLVGSSQITQLQPVIALTPPEASRAAVGGDQGKKPAAQAEGGKRGSTVTLMGTNGSLSGLLAGYSSDTDSDSDAEDEALGQKKEIVEEEKIANPP